MRSAESAKLEQAKPLPLVSLPVPQVPATCPTSRLSEPARLEQSIKANLGGLGYGG